MASERRPEVQNVTEYPELGMTGRPGVPHKTLNTDYPVRDPKLQPLAYSATNNALLHSSSTPTRTSDE